MPSSDPARFHLGKNIPGSGAAPRDAAALSLQGPTSATVLAAAGMDVSGLKPFRLAVLATPVGEIRITRTALLAEQERGSRRALVGLDVPGNIAAGGAILYHAKRAEAGTEPAAAWSPACKASIALAQVL